MPKNDTIYPSDIYPSDIYPSDAKGFAKPAGEGESFDPNSRSLPTAPTVANSQSRPADFAGPTQPTSNSPMAAAMAVAKHVFEAIQTIAHMVSAGHLKSAAHEFIANILRTGSNSRSEAGSRMEAAVASFTPTEGKPTEGRGASGSNDEQTKAHTAAMAHAMQMYIASGGHSHSSSHGQNSSEQSAFGPTEHGGRPIRATSAEAVEGRAWAASGSTSGQNGQATSNGRIGDGSATNVQANSFKPTVNQAGFSR